MKSTTGRSTAALKSKLTATLLGWAERRDTANRAKRSSRGDAASSPSGAGFSHRLLDAAGIRLIPEEDVKSSLWCVRRRGSFVLTNRRIIYAQQEGRGVTAHWAELSEVKNAGVTKVGRNNPLLAAGVSCWLVGVILAFLVGFWGLAPFLVIGAGLNGAWFVSEGNATVYASLGGQQMQGEISKKDQRKASEFVNLLFELKQV